MSEKPRIRLVPLKDWNTAAVVVFIILALALSAILKSRAFFLGYIIATISYYVWFSGVRISKLFYVLLVAGVIVVGIALTCFIKSDSSYGRLFIYKVSLPMLKNNWADGIGIGKFKTKYLYNQANYFRSHQYSQKELLVADNTYYLFNDFVQFIIETGVKGVLLLYIVFTLTAKLIRIAFRNNGNSIILIVCFVQLVAIAVAACFDHVLYFFHFQVATCILITIISVYAVYGSVRKQLFPLCIGSMATVALIGYHYNFSIDYYIGKKEINSLSALYRAGYRLEAKDRLKQLGPSLENDYEYLDLLSHIQLSEGAPQKAEATLRKLIAIRVSSNYYVNLADIYALLGDYSKAEHAYLQAIYMVPNRFTSRYSLYRLYKQTHQYSNAATARYQILHLPVKVPSRLIDDIKIELLNNN